MKQKDSIIILAWPQTPVKTIGRWYDGITKYFGFLKGEYYMAGHAACVLVDHSCGELHYFDFGRYHMPNNFGRARNKETDPGLNLKTKLVISDENKVLNIDEILKELSNNKDCHGEGPLYASLLKNISFKHAYDYAIGIQNNDAVHYGPYMYRGTNCSRFITSTAKRSMPTRKIKFRLSASLLFTPLTKANVFACNNVYYRVENNQISKLYLTLKDQLNNFMLPFIIKKRSTVNQHINIFEQIETIQNPVSPFKA